MKARTSLQNLPLPSRAPEPLDADGFYRALLARDERFDGRFFVGVRTTGVYCRPVCRVRAPKAENCAFFRSAALAEAEGFRPCLRCRPEIAPGVSACEATARLATVAARLLEDTSDAEGPVEGPAEGARLSALATRLGTSDRHLRRVFSVHFGVSPVEYWQTRRLLEAKRLLTDTRLPITDVAFAAGFESLRRFHAAFRQRYGLAPSALRNETLTASTRVPVPAPAAVFRLAYRPPLAWDALLAFLADRAVAGVEAIAHGRYVRAVRIAVPGETSTRAGWVAVDHDARACVLRVTLADALVPAAPRVLARVRRLFDLSCDPLEVERVLRPTLPVPLVLEGLRVPGAFEPFETAVRALLGQQVSVRAATTLASRLVFRYGERLSATPLDEGHTPNHEVTHTFPSSRRLAEESPEDLAALGLPLARARALSALAKEHAAGRLDFEGVVDVDAFLARLRALPGIGPWTVQYLAMRTLSWPDAFPVGDLGVRRALGFVSARPTRGEEMAILTRAEAWRPWRAYAVMHLWHALSLPSGASSHPSKKGTTP